LPLYVGCATLIDARRICQLREIDGRDGLWVALAEWAQANLRALMAKGTSTLRAEAHVHRRRQIGVVFAVHPPVCPEPSLCIHTRAHRAYELGDEGEGTMQIMPCVISAARSCAHLKMYLHITRAPTTGAPNLQCSVLLCSHSHCFPPDRALCWHDLLPVSAEFYFSLHLRTLS
jgi:hypothetical protein